MNARRAGGQLFALWPAPASNVSNWRGGLSNILRSSALKQCGKEMSFQWSQNAPYMLPKWCSIPFMFTLQLVQCLIEMGPFDYQHIPCNCKGKTKQPSLLEEKTQKENPSTAERLNNLAELYLAQGRYAQAESLCRRAVSICDNVLGSEHPDTITYRQCLRVIVSKKEAEQEDGDHPPAPPLFCSRSHASAGDR